MHKEPINIGKAAKEFRKEHNITKEQLAERLKGAAAPFDKRLLSGEDRGRQQEAGDEYLPETAGSFGGGYGNT